nr:hypothetical protein [uncultured Mediterranean phage uvMED]
MIKHKSTRRRAPLLWRRSDLKIKKRWDKLFSKKKRDRKKERKLLDEVFEIEMDGIYSNNSEKKRQGKDAMTYGRLKNYDSKLFKKTK